MKKLLLGLTLATTVLTSTLAQAGSYSCSNDIQNDLVNQVSRKKEAVRVITAPAKLCLGLDQHGKSKVTSVVFGCALSAVMYGVMPVFASGTLGFPGALGAVLVTGALGYEKRFSFSQIALNTHIVQYYDGENPQEALEAIQKRYFRGRKMYRSNKVKYRATTEEIGNFLEENRKTKALCSNNGTRKRLLKITDAGIEYLAQRGLVAMDLVMNDEITEEFKEYVSRRFLYTELEILGTSITSKQFKNAVLNK